jgi:hypothetical protein
MEAAREEQENEAPRRELLDMQNCMYKWTWPLMTLVVVIPQIVACVAILSEATFGIPACVVGAMDINTWIVGKLVWIVLHDIILRGKRYDMLLKRIRRGQEPADTSTQSTIMIVCEDLFELLWLVLGWIWWSQTRAACSSASASLVLAICIVDTILLFFFRLLPLCVIRSIHCVVQWMPRTLPPAVPPIEEDQLQYVVKKMPYQAAHGTSTSCSICITDFTENEEVARLTCQVHAFHVPCITAWISRRGNCPDCRAVAAIQSETNV